MISRSLAGVAVVAVIAAALPARAQKAPAMTPEAKAHFDRGIAHYAAKEYDAASRELAEAFFADPKREILFAWAQAKRLADDCASAIPLYRKYLDSDPPAKTAKVARQHLARCEKRVGPGGEGSDPSVKPEPKPDPVEEMEPPIEPSEAARPASTPSRRKPWYKDALGDALVVAGAAGLGVGTVFWLKSNGSREDADQAESYADYQRAVADGRSQRKIAIAGLAAGGTLVAAGVLRWALRGGGGEGPPAVAVTADGAGAGVALGWEF